MHSNLRYLGGLIAVAFGLTTAGAAATYSPGFFWNWEADYSATDCTPSDAGSIALAPNAGKSTGTPTEDIWAYLDISAEVPGGFPGGTQEPNVLFPNYVTYWDTYGHVWLRLGTAAPAVGVDDGTTPLFSGANAGRHFLLPAATDPDRETVALKFTAPQPGLYQINATFDQARPVGTSNGVGVRIVKNTTPLIDREIVARQTTRSYNLSQGLQAGDRLYVCLSANLDVAFDENVLTLTITYAGSETAASDWIWY